MQVYYIEIDKFLKTHSKNFLLPYADIEINTEKRFYEYTIGRYLVKCVAQKYYNIDNTEINMDKNSKPTFKNANLHFSISHSNNIVIACFDKYPCGIDIEYMKARDIKKLSEYFNEKFDTLENFYKFWTIKEASYKLNHSSCFTHSYFEIENYCLSIASKVLPPLSIVPKLFLNAT